MVLVLRILLRYATTKVGGAALRNVQKRGGKNGIQQFFIGGIIVEITFLRKSMFVSHSRTLHFLCLGFKRSVFPPVGCSAEELLLIVAHAIKLMSFLHIFPCNSLEVKFDLRQHMSYDPTCSLSEFSS